MPVRIPINTELQHLAPGYDPQKAHDYYEKHKHLKGRKRGSSTSSPQSPRAPQSIAKARQKVELQNSIRNLEAKLGKLEQLIHQKEAVLRRDQAQAKVKARQKKDKPKTAAEKAKLARENKKYRDKHKTQLHAKAKQAAAKSGGGSKAASSQKPSDMSIANLKSLATRVRGQIAVAKQKLAAL